MKLAKWNRKSIVTSCQIFIISSPGHSSHSTCHKLSSFQRTNQKNFYVNFAISIFYILEKYYKIFFRHFVGTFRFWWFACSPSTPMTQVRIVLKTFPVVISIAIFKPLLVKIKILHRQVIRHHKSQSVVQSFIECLIIFLNGLSPASFSFIFVFSNKHYNSCNKYM